MTEKEKMKAGLWYDANNDQELIDQRLICQDLCFALNQLKPSDEKRNEVIENILGYFPDDLVLLSPFTADYGKKIKLGKNVFVNINNYFMDGATIEIGDNVFIGPSCGFYTANHPLDYTNRNQGLEKALPIKIGDNCWFGANVSVMPGVTIGEGCVIAAGAVVTKDMPANSLIAGVPAKVICTVEELAEKYLANTPKYDDWHSMQEKMKTSEMIAVYVREKKQNNKKLRINSPTSCRKYIFLNFFN